MKKFFLKKIVPILLVICLVFSMTIVASANPLALIIGEIIFQTAMYSLGAFLTAEAVNLSAEVFDRLSTIYEEWVYNQTEGTTIFEASIYSSCSRDGCTYTTNHVVLSIPEAVVFKNAETEACALYVVDYFNGFVHCEHNSIYDEVGAAAYRSELSLFAAEFDYNLDGTATSVSLRTYSFIKQIVGNAVTSYVAFLNAKEEAIAKEKALLALQEAGKLYTFDFDFVGPLQPGITVPVSTEYIPLDRVNYRYSVPIHFKGLQSDGVLDYFYSKEEAEAFRFANYYYSVNSLYMPQYYGRLQEFYSYIIFENNIYYSQISTFPSIDYYYKLIDGTFFNSVYSRDKFKTYYLDPYNKTGSLYELESFDPFDFNSFYYGYVMNFTSQDNSIVSTVIPDDFSNTTGGTIEIPKSEAENLIGDGLSSGVIDDTSSITLDKEGNITSVNDMTLEDLTAAIAAANNIDIDKDYDFDVETPQSIIDKFPFCLPFDIYNAFNILSAEPEAPVFSIPLKMEGVFDYSIEVDLSQFNDIANIVRWFLYVIFIVGLALVTNKLLGRG